MKYKYASCLFLAAFLLQTTLLNVVGLFGVTPNLLLCLVVSFSFLYDEGYQGLVLGTLFGLIYDICCLPYVGVSALGYMVVAMAVMLINIALNKELVVSILLIAVASTWLYQSLLWGMMALLGSPYGYVYMLRHLPLQVLYNVAVTLILYYALIRKVIRYHKDKYYHKDKHYKKEKYYQWGKR